MIGHGCPIRGCALLVPRTQLLCRTHWYLVPKALRDEIWRAYRGGAREQAAHRRACGEAIRLVNDLQREGAAS